MGISRPFPPRLSFYAAATRARFERHVDNEGGDPRVLTAVYYLNGGRAWDPGADGGALRLTAPATGADVDVAPNLNRVVVFWSRLVAHEVRPALRDRFAASMWFKEPHPIPAGA